MHLVFHHTVGKQPQEPRQNDDYYSPNSFSEEGPFVISDGASESYDAKTWSRLLVRLYRRQPEFSSEWVDHATAFYTSSYDVASLSWSRQAAFERGSFATLLAIHANGGQQAEILAVGDSLAVLGNGGCFRQSFPYETPEQFAAHPLLISTVKARNAALLESDPRSFRTSWKLDSRASILAMTDALGQWLLSDPAGRYPVLANLRDRRQFATLVETERAERRMKRDDTTLLVLQG
jgi:serine/threonine protein phosphatase PrpC